MNEEYIKMTDEEIIQYCKNNNILYLQKNKKVYTRKTLIRNIMKSKKTEINDEPKNIIIQENIEINKVVWTLEGNKDINQNYKQIRDNLCNIIKKCHQLLYSNHSIVGTKAQNDIMKILTLKILQPQFANKDTQLYKKCEQLLENGDISKDDFNDYMSYCIDINILKNVSERKNPLNEWKIFVGYFLIKIMPSLYDINDNRFNFDDEKTFMELIKIINELNISDTFIDAFSTTYGDIHEAFRVYGGGKGAKELGQFFTPRHLIHSIFNGCGFNDIIKSYKNPTIYDPCMGTGGLLTRAYSNGNILPNDIYGCETEKDTIKFGECSILLTTNEFNSNIVKCDSLCNNPYLFNDKFDIIFTNPPFGTKMKYEELEKKYNDFNINNHPINFKTIYPYKTNNGACLFIQHCMYILKENGTCAILLPDGELFYGKTFSKFRKFMCDNVNIIKIINVEGGAFEYTSIKISIVIFQKNCSTKNIEFMNIPKECNEVKSCAIVNINNIIKENYSFNLSNYIKKEVKNDTKFEIKKLEDICEIKYGKFNSNDMNNNGDIPFYSCKCNNPIGFHDKYSFDYDKNYLLLITSGGSMNNMIGDNVGLGKCYMVNGKTACRAGVCSLNLKLDNVNIKYIYYYLNNNRIETNKKAKFTTNLGVISSDDIRDLEIPIPSLEIQEKIIKDIEKILKSIETIKIRIEQLNEEKELFMKFYKKSELEELNKKAEIKKLGDICEIKYGTRIVKKDITNGEFPCYGGGDISFYINEYNREGFNILISRFALSERCVRLLNIKFYLNDSGLTINSKDKSILDKYIAHYLSNNQDIIYNIARGTAQKNLDMEKFKNIEIPIPSLEDQEKIINIYKEIEEIHKIRFLDKIEEEKKHIDLLNDISNNIFNQ